MSEQDYVQMVTPLVDGEEVLAAGVFQPRGTQGGMDAAGGLLGTHNVGAAAAGMVGIVEAGHVASAVERQPRWTILAVTPTRVLAFEGVVDGIHWKPGARYATFARAGLGVSAKGRMSTRVLVLESTDDGTHLDLETMRVGPQHGTDVIRVLGA
ncbi:MAG: hypothetical protein FJW88_13515 [Actinobacteria bacterium]|nr:hypothetical protein [Actinomycetota bacterium]